MAHLPLKWLSEAFAELPNWMCPIHKNPPFPNVTIKTDHLRRISVTSFVQSPPFFLSLRPVVQTHSFTQGFSVSAPNV